MKIRIYLPLLQELTSIQLSNMAVTKTDNQRLSLKKNLKKIYSLSQAQPDECSVKHLFSPSTDKWSLFCLYHLAGESNLRFSALQKRVPGISARMLSTTLKKLEALQLLTRKAYPEVPPRVEYKLTKFGYTYTERLLELNLWLYKAYQKQSR